MNFPPNYSSLETFHHNDRKPGSGPNSSFFVPDLGEKKCDDFSESLFDAIEAGIFVSPFVVEPET